MDKVLSARIDDRILRQINDLANRMNTTKKAVIESAIELLSMKVDSEKNRDVFDDTCGAWLREESAEETVCHARAAFRNSMFRYNKNSI